MMKQYVDVGISHKQMKVLLSIKPEFANKIFSNEKIYEFRKVIFKDKSVKDVVVYASSPVSEIIGKFTIAEIIQGTPETVWKLTKDKAGITKDYFNQYFKNKELAYAIKIKQAKRYSKSIKLQDLGIKYAPQSFMYLI